MPIASDGAGNFLTLGSDGQWAPATVATHPESGAKLILDGSEWKPLPGSEPSHIGSALRGVVRGATFGFNDELRAGTDALAQGVGNLIHGSEGRPSMGQAYDTSLAANREADRQDYATNPVSSTAGDLVGTVGGVLAAPEALAASGVARIAAPLAARIPQAVRTVGGVAGGGALAGGVAGFGSGEGASNRLDQAATGAVVGGTIGALTQGAGRLLAPVRSVRTPEGAALVAEAQREGIPLSAGQITGSRVLQNAEERLGQLPGAAGGQARFVGEQRRAFNSAALSRTGEVADIASPEVLNRASQRIGGVINNISNRNTMAVTPQFEARLGQIEGSLRFIPAEQAGPVRARIEQLRGMMIQPQATSGGTPHVPGASYQLLDSEIGKAIRSAGPSHGYLAAALGDLRTTLRAAMDASITPGDAAAWHEARRQYANLMVIRDATSGAGGAVAEGNVSPLALRGALDRSTGGGYEMGRGDLNQLARIGQNTLRGLPDSHTPAGSYMNSLLTGGFLTGGGAGIGAMAAGPVGAVAGAVAPVALPAAIGAAMRSRAGQAYLTNQLGPALQGPIDVTAAALAAQAARHRWARD